MFDIHVYFRGGIPLLLWWQLYYSQSTYGCHDNMELRYKHHTSVCARLQPLRFQIHRRRRKLHTGCRQLSGQHVHSTPTSGAVGHMHVGCIPALLLWSSIHHIQRSFGSHDNVATRFRHSDGIGPGLQPVHIQVHGIRNRKQHRCGDIVRWG